MTTTEIIDDNPAMAFRVRDIDLLRQTLTAEKYAVENRPLEVSYLLRGPAGRARQGAFTRPTTPGAFTG